MKIYNNLEQGTEEWLEVRKGKITGTKLKGVTGGPKAQQTEIYTLLAEQYIEEEYMSAFDIIQRGNDLEPIAKKKYEELTGQVVEEVGFIEKDDGHGLSPDGIIVTKSASVSYGLGSDGNKDIFGKAIEIKCPRGKNYIKYLLENKLPDEYKQQVINYFIVMEDLEELDFIIYNPDVSKEIPELHIITVTRAELQKDIEKAEAKLKDFKKDWDSMKTKLRCHYGQFPYDI